MDSIELRTTQEGILLPLKVLPGSRQNAFRGVHDGALKVSVTAVAEKGKANQAVIQFLAKQWSLSRSQLSVQSGHTDSRKTILVQQVSNEQLQEMLRAVLE